MRNKHLERLDNSPKDTYKWWARISNSSWHGKNSFILISFLLFTKYTPFVPLIRTLVCSSPVLRFLGHVHTVTKDQYNLCIFSGCVLYNSKKYHSSRL